VHAIAIRYQTSLWPVGAMLRASCMAGFWLLLPWFPYRSLIQDAAMLALGSIGAVTSWAHNRSSLLDLMAAHNIAGLSHAARHLLAARKRATADLAGLLEGFGIISVGLLFAGPLEVRPLPATVPPSLQKCLLELSYCTESKPRPADGISARIQTIHSRRLKRPRK